MTSFLERVFIYGSNPFVGDYEMNRLRPPGAVDEKRFMGLCIRCNRCLEVCPYGSIKRSGIGLTIGTPYVMAETRGCYLCMACCRLCPTAALDHQLEAPNQVRMGKARIDTSICYSHLFLEHDVLPAGSGNKIGAICNTCYNVCPLQDTAITLGNNLFPVILDGCVGCGICVERCPTRPRRAVNVFPSGMGRVDEAGFYFRKARRHYDTTLSSESDLDSLPLKGDKLLNKKSTIQGSQEQPKFEFPYKTPKAIEGWE